MLFCVETVWFDIVLFDDFIPRFLSNLALKRKGVNGEVFLRDNRIHVKMTFIVEK